MTNPSSWFAATTLFLGSLVVASTVAAAELPVKIDAFQGEVVQVNGATHSGVTPGKALAAGTEVKTGRDGRADLSLHGDPTLSLGQDVNILLHSMDRDVLRVRVASGALRVDARAAATPGSKSRDVRLNAGDLRLRLAGSAAWVEVSERSGQVCVIEGVVEAQQPTGAVRLDTAGQCLRQTGPSSQWTMIPLDLLETRVAATGVPKVVAAASPAPAPSKPPLQIKVLPLPGTMPEEPLGKPQVVVLQQAPDTSSLDVKVADVEVPAVPDPPAPLPVAPAAAAVAVKVAAPVDVPEVPPAPEPLPVVPAPAMSVAMKGAEPVEVPVVPDVPAPLPVPAAPPATEVATATAAVDPGSEASPALDDGRRWRVVLGSMPEKEKAEMEAERLNARGWAVEAREYHVGERRGFRIGFGEFLAREDAQKALDEFLVQYPNAPGWLAKY